eukprot:CAMPEP_0183318106 /NCGR_PEP_ID=MMETSP0160_2-20130417/59750_1 /TAXON_ID=2839 ORGANISM="Odontella Sinensis, Strain Grunow 1884" /NCGR_SAMPLE_ID=MMETSP0160_2 /ASSEMBLY_ACC=CAM_ASM_000250 /LENGTH=183 /DNA_ID=CAMNT_0025484281 /DNA_START=59 /DNA_END=606 /DNA_ORIENTATION=+
MMRRRHRPGPCNPLGRFSALFLRSWRQNVRNVRINLLRLLTVAGEAVLFAELFDSCKPGRDVARSVADRTALLSFGVINVVMMGVMKTLYVFGNEREVVARERQRNQYKAIEYLLSKAAAELPLDAAFSAAFALGLKARTGLRTSGKVLGGTFAVMAMAGTALGFAVGSLSTHGAEGAMALGV